MADFMSEDDAADYRQQDLEERVRNRLIRMGRRGGPDAPELCEDCDGKGSFWKKEPGGNLSGCRTLCRRCLGTGVQP